MLECNLQDPKPRGCSERDEERRRRDERRLVVKVVDYAYLGKFLYSQNLAECLFHVGEGERGDIHLLIFLFIHSIPHPIPHPWFSLLRKNPGSEYKTSLATMSNDDTDILPLRRTKTPDPADGDVKDRYTESQNTHINDDASASSIDIDIEYPSTIYDSQSPSQSYASIDHTKYAHQVQAASPLRFYDGTLSLDQKDQHLQWVEEQGSQNDTTSIGYNLDQPSTVTALNGGINEIVEKPEESSSSAFATGNIDCICKYIDSASHPDKLQLISLFPESRAGSNSCHFTVI